MNPESSDLESIGKRLEKCEQIQKALYQLSSELNSSKDFNVICTSCYEMVSEVLGTKNFSIWLVDPQDRFILAFARDEIKNFQTRAPDPLLAERVFRSGQTLLISRDQVDELILSKEIESIEEPFAFWLGVPLKTEKRIDGVLAVKSDDADLRFDAEQIDFLSCAGNLMSTILTLKREKETLKENLMYQSAIAVLAQSALGEEDYGASLNEAVVLISRILGVEFCEVLELLPDHKSFFSRAGIGWRDTSASLSLVPATIESLAGSTLFSDVPLIIEDLRTESIFRASPLLYEHGVVSGMSIKIHRKGQAYGVLGAFTAEQRVFTSAALYFMETVANILATSIQEKRIEKAIQESHERLKLAIKAQDQVIWDWDILTDEMWWSESMEAVFGYKRDEVGSSFAFKQSKIHPEDRDQVVSDLYDSFSGQKEKWRDIYRFARVDDSYANVRDYGIVIYNETGKALRMIGALSEIADRKRKRLR